MKTVKEFREERDLKIYRASKRHSYKYIAYETGLSTSRIKAICAEQRKITEVDCACATS